MADNPDDHSGSPSAPTEVRLVGAPGGKRMRCYDIQWDDAPDSLEGTLDVLVPADVVAEWNNEDSEVMEDYLSEVLQQEFRVAGIQFNFEEWHVNLDSPLWPIFEKWYPRNFLGAPCPREDDDLFRAFAAGAEQAPTRNTSLCSLSLMELKWLAGMHKEMAADIAYHSGRRRHRELMEIAAKIEAANMMKACPDSSPPITKE